ncbi:MAG: cobalt ECF transporter T component CbiQ [bacterium]
MVHLMDCYAYTSRWRLRHPAEKAAFAGGLLLLSFFMPLSGLLIILLMVSLVALLGARIPYALYGRVMAIPMAFILIGASSLLVTLSFHSGLIHFGLTNDGVIPAIRLVARAMAAASCLIFFSLTTPTADWMPLLRKFYVPTVVVDLMMMTYRHLFVFAERLSTLQQAQAARLGNLTFKSRIRTTGLIGANLFIRSLDRARRIELGMEARCYNGEIPCLPFERKPSLPIIIGVLILCLVIAWIGFLTKRWPYA